MKKLRPIRLSALVLALTLFFSCAPRTPTQSDGSESESVEIVFPPEFEEFTPFEIPDSLEREHIIAFYDKHSSLEFDGKSFNSEIAVTLEYKLGSNAAKYEIFQSSEYVISNEKTTYKMRSYGGEGMENLDMSFVYDGNYLYYTDQSKFFKQTMDNSAYEEFLSDNSSELLPNFKLENCENISYLKTEDGFEIDYSLQNSELLNALTPDIDDIIGSKNDGEVMSLNGMLRFSQTELAYFSSIDIEYVIDDNITLLVSLAAISTYTGRLTHIPFPENSDSYKEVDDLDAYINITNAMNALVSTLTANSEVQGNISFTSGEISFMHETKIEHYFDFQNSPYVYSKQSGKYLQNGNPLEYNSVYEYADGILNCESTVEGESVTKEMSLEDAQLWSYSIFYSGYVNPSLIIDFYTVEKNDAYCTYSVAVYEDAIYETLKSHYASLGINFDQMAKPRITSSEIRITLDSQERISQVEFDFSFVSSSPSQPYSGEYGVSAIYLYELE